MKKIPTQLKRSLILTIVGVVCGAIFSIAFGYAHATGWMSNKSTPPADNVDSFINVSAADQEKGPDSTCNGANANCGLAVGTFLASQNAAFGGSAFFRTLITGLTTGSDLTKSALAIGDDSAGATLAINNNAKVTDGGMYSDQILAAGPTLEPLCADKDGNIIFCPTETIPPPPPPPQVINGSIDYSCTDYRTGNDFHAGIAHMTITFDAPLAQPVDMQFAYCSSNSFLGPGYKDTCSGKSLIPVLPPGYTVGVGDNTGPWAITLPAGTRSYSVPDTSLSNPWIDIKGNATYFTCVNNGSKDHPETNNLGYAYFKLLSPSGWTLNFTGISHWSSAGTSPINIIQVP